MGEGQSKVQTRLLANTNPLIQRYLAPKPQVSPYKDGMPYNAQQESILQMFLNKNSILNASANQSYVNNQSGIYGDQSNRLLSSPEPMLKSSIRKEFRSKFANMTPDRGSPDQQAILISEAYSNEEYPFQLENDMKTQSRFVSQETFNNNKSQNLNRFDERDNNRQYSPEYNNDRYSRERDNNSLRYDDRQSKRGYQQASGFDRSIRDERMERSRSPEIRTKPSFQDERPRFQYRSPAEERFSQEEVEILRGNFDAYSKDNRLTEFHLLKLLSLEDFEKSFIGNRIYNCIKQISSKGATFGNYVNYERYVQAMAILARGTIQERLDFVYNIFDPRGEGRVTYEEMNIVMGDLFRILRSTKFEHSTLNTLCEKVNEIDEDEIEFILEELIKEIFAAYGNNPNYLTFEEWKSWFMGQFGMTDVLNWKIKRIEV